MPVIFPAGALVCFRALDSTDKFARHFMPTARDMEHTADRHFLFFDENRALIGTFPEDFVAAILPIETVGPAANAQD